MGQAVTHPRGCLLHARVKFLQAHHEGVEGTRVDDGLGQLRGVLGDGAEAEGRGLLVKAVLFTAGRGARGGQVALAAVAVVAGGGDGDEVMVTGHHGVIP